MKHLNRVLAALLSLAIIVGGLLLIIEVIADRVNHRPALWHWRSFYKWAGRTQWQAGAVRVICVALIVVGLILLVAELKRRRVARLRLAEETAGIDAAYTRRGVAAAVKAAVSDVDGIRAVRTTVKRRKVIVTATAGAADKTAAAQLRTPVTEAAQHRLALLTLKSTPSVSASVKPRSS